MWHLFHKRHIQSTAKKKQSGECQKTHSPPIVSRSASFTLLPSLSLRPSLSLPPFSPFLSLSDLSLSEASTSVSFLLNLLLCNPASSPLIFLLMMVRVDAVRRLLHPPVIHLPHISQHIEKGFGEIKREARSLSRRRVVEGVRVVIVVPPFAPGEQRRDG